MLALHRILLLQNYQLWCLNIKTRWNRGGPNMWRYKHFIPSNVNIYCDDPSSPIVSPPAGSCSWMSNILSGVLIGCRDFWWEIEAGKTVWKSGGFWELRREQLNTASWLYLAKKCKTIGHFKIVDREEMKVCISWWKNTLPKVSAPYFICKSLKVKNKHLKVCKIRWITSSNKFKSK